MTTSSLIGDNLFSSILLKLKILSRSLAKSKIDTLFNNFCDPTLKVVVNWRCLGNVTILGSRTAQYDVVNKPTRIGNTQFVYGPAHEKVKTISGDITTYHYAGGSYLEESTD